MLNRFALAGLALLCLISVSCRRPKASEPWISRHAPWSDGEVSTFDVLKGDNRRQVGLHHPLGRNQRQASLGNHRRKLVRERWPARLDRRSAELR